MTRSGEKMLSLGQVGGAATAQAKCSQRFAEELAAMHSRLAAHLHHVDRSDMLEVESLIKSKCV